MTGKVLSQLVGGSSIPVGAIVALGPNLPDDFTQAGQRYLREGVFELNPSNFDAAKFSKPIRSVVPIADFPRATAGTLTGVQAQNGAVDASSDGRYVAVWTYAANSTTSSAMTLWLSEDYGKTWTLLDSRSFAYTVTQISLKVSDAGVVGYVIETTDNTTYTATVYNPTTRSFVSTTLAGTALGACVECNAAGTIWVVTTASAAVRFAAGAWSAITVARRGGIVRTFDGTVWFSASSSNVTALSRSTDSGATWSDVALGATRTLSDIDSGDGTTIVAGCTTVNSLFRSTDAGATWTEVTLATGDSYAEVLATSALNFCAISSGAGDPAIYSTDGGATWTQSATSFQITATTSGLVNGKKVAVHFGSGVVMVLSPTAQSAHGATLFRSNDHGQTWAPVYYLPYSPNSMRVNGNKRGRLEAFYLIFGGAFTADFDTALFAVCDLSAAAGLPLEDFRAASSAVRYLRVS